MSDQETLIEKFTSLIDDGFTARGFTKSRKSKYIFNRVEKRKTCYIKIIRKSNFGGHLVFDVQLGVTTKVLARLWEETEGQKLSKPLYTTDLGYLIQEFCSTAVDGFKQTSQAFTKRYSAFPLGTWDIRSEKDLKKVSRVLLAYDDFGRPFFANDFPLNFFCGVDLSASGRLPIEFLRAQILIALKTGDCARALEVLAWMKLAKKQSRWVEKYETLILSRC